MIKTVIVTIAALAAIVVAQTPNTEGIPQCLITCSQQSCANLTDLECICVTNVAAITQCALSSCSQADLTNATTIAAEQCGNVIWSYEIPDPF